MTTSIRIAGNTLYFSMGTTNREGVGIAETSVLDTRAMNRLFRACYPTPNSIPPSSSVITVTNAPKSNRDKM